MARPSSYPPNVKAFIYTQRLEDVPARKVAELVAEKWPEHSEITSGGVYHIEQSMRASLADGASVSRLEPTKIRMPGPAWSIEGIENAVPA